MSPRVMRLLIAALAVAALWTAPAHADVFSYDPATDVGSYLQQRDAMSNPNVRELVAFAHDWLADRGLHECATGPTGHVYMAPDLDDAGGRAYNCDVWIATYVVGDANGGDLIELDWLGFAIGHELMHASRDVAHPDGWTHEQMGEFPGYDSDGNPEMHVGPGIEADYRLACRWHVRAMVARAKAARRARLLAARRVRRA